MNRLIYLDNNKPISTEETYISSWCTYPYKLLVLDTLEHDMVVDPYNRLASILTDQHLLNYLMSRKRSTRLRKDSVMLQVS